MNDVPDAPPSGVLETVAPVLAPADRAQSLALHLHRHLRATSSARAKSPFSIRGRTTSPSGAACGGGRGRAGRLCRRHPHRIATTARSPGGSRRRRAPKIVGARPHVPRPGAPQGLDAAHDLTYAPDRILGDGESVAFGEHALTALATPGHAANHLCFSWGEALFSGDHVMALVDLGGRAARRVDGRLHGIAGKAARPRRDNLLARPRRPGARPEALRARAHHPPQASARRRSWRGWRRARRRSPRSWSRTTSGSRRS